MNVAKARRERGVTVPFIALSLVSLLTFAGLVLDGGNAYATRRQMQNAADAASLAGAVQLDEEREGTTPDYSNVLDAVVTSLGQNDADTSNFECRFVDETGADMGACPSAPTSTIDPDVAGVEVRASSTKDTVFMRVVGRPDFTASASAAATRQVLIAIDPIYTPFMLCARQSDPDLPDVLNPDYSFNDEAIYDPAEDGPWFNASASNAPDVRVESCGLDASSFRGWVSDRDERNNGQLGTWWYNLEGRRDGPADTALLDVTTACRDEVLDGCILVVPVCTEADEEHSSNNDSALMCVRFGAFRVREIPPNRGFQVALLGPARVSQGRGGGNPTDTGESRLIKLIE